MTKYLDQNGLAYFWTKIKAWLSSHAPVKYFGQNWVEDVNDDYALVVGDGADSNNLENVSAIAENGRFLRFANGMSASSAPQSTDYCNTLEVLDDDNSRRLLLQTSNYQSGKQGVALRAQRLVNGSTIYNGFDMMIDSSGNRTVEVNDKVAWQDALEPWSTSFPVAHPTADFTKANNNVSSNQYPNFIITDKNNKVGARFESIIQTDGKVGFYIYGKNYDTSGTDKGAAGIKMLADKTGATEWTVGNPSGFRKALGLGQSDGALPLTIAQGGTGMTAVSSDTTVSNIISAASGITITEAFAAQWGKMVWIRFLFKKNAAISVPANGDISDTLIGTLKEKYRPTHYLTPDVYGNTFTVISKWGTGPGNVIWAAANATGAARTIPANTSVAVAFLAILP